jgi:hypothetical protein
VRAVLAHQQPARKSGPDFVKAQAGRRVRALLHQHIQVALQPVAQRSAAREFTPERHCRHAPGGTGPLHQGLQRIARHAQRQLHAQHAFPAGHADLQAMVVIHHGDQRDEALGREIGIACGLARLAQHLRQLQMHRLAQSQQAGPIGARQRGNEFVLGMRQGDP